MRRGMKVSRWLAIPAILAVALLAGQAAADDDFAPGVGEVTYSKDIAPIFFSKCSSCHRPGEAAPMSLMSYTDARPWVKSIKKSISSKEMPPWDADPAHGKFANDISLSETEIAAIVKWVDSGAPEGDPAQTPKAPEFKSGWQLGEPDYVIELPEVDVPAEGEDLFPNLSVTIDIPEKRWIRAVEVRPGNRDVLHHIVLFTAGFGMGSGGTFDALAVWAVGTGPVVYPERSGRWVKPKMNVTANMHYHPNGKPQKDKSTVALFFGEGDMEKEISSALAGTVNFNIPPNTKDYKLDADYYVGQDIKIVSLFPHMHMRGQSMKFTAKYPDGREEILLNVPNYDFNWQWFYYPEKDLVLPEDTEIHIEAVYNNTKENPNNPDPSISLTFGEGSSDEMMFGFLEFVPVEGVKPKPMSPAKMLAKVTSKFAKENVYSLSSNMGMMNFQTRMHLPKDGSDGAWYLAFGGSVMPMDLKDVKWNGNEFTFNLSFLGGKMGMMKASGKVDEAGNIEGKFDFDEGMAARMEEFNRNAGATSATTAKAEPNADSKADDKAGDGEGRRHRGGRGGGMGMFMREFKGTRAS